MKWIKGKPDLPGAYWFGREGSNEVQIRIISAGLGDDLLNLPGWATHYIAIGKPLPPDVAIDKFPEADPTTPSVAVLLREQAERDAKARNELYMDLNRRMQRIEGGGLTEAGKIQVKRLIAEAIESVVEAESERTAQEATDLLNNRMVLQGASIEYLMKRVEAAESNIRALSEWRALYDGILIGMRHENENTRARVEQVAEVSEQVRESVLRHTDKIEEGLDRLNAMVQPVETIDTPSVLSVEPIGEDLED